MKPMVRQETETHVVRRLESFSDIVMGFSLGMLTLNLGFPPHGAIELFTTNPWPLIGFGVTFFFVSIFWWANHRLFTYYFVPTAPGIVLFFVTLGGVLFLTYAVQLLLHGGTHDRVAYAMYTGSIGFVALINGALTLQGIHLRSPLMERNVLRAGVRRVIMSVLAAAVLIPLAVATGTGTFRGEIGFPVAAAVVIAGLCARLLTRRYFAKRRAA